VHPWSEPHPEPVLPEPQGRQERLQVLQAPPVPEQPQEPVLVPSARSARE